MSGEEPYERLIAWLKNAWNDLPEAAALLPLIKTRYTAEEAAFLTGLPFSPKPLEDLARVKGMDPDRLAVLLDELALKGVIFRATREGRLYYGLNDTFFIFLRSSFWPGRSDEVSVNMAPLVNQYYYNGFFDQFATSHIRGLRALPVEETIEPELMHQILPYEDVVKVLDHQDYFCVTTCPCRHRKNLDPDSPSCQYSTENCLHFGPLARYIVENALGREISREETHDILRQAADEGLVHGVSNWVKGVDTICNCCKCCCMWFESYHVLKQVGSMDASNYIVRVKPATCRACGLCVKRCPMNALCLEDSNEAKNRKGKAPALQDALCIGCGVCAHKCPTKSLVLIRREQVTDPPSDPRDYTRRFLAELQSS